MPLRAAYVAISVVAVSLVVERVLLQIVSDRLPLVGLVAISTIVGYGPMVGYVLWASRRWGTGRPVHDYGFSIRPVDAGWGPLVWLCGIFAEIVVGAIVVATKIPLKSNTTGLSKLKGQHDVLLAVAISAVIAAPFVEELIFRGLIMRSFLSSMPAWLAIGLQGTLFGLAHVGPERGIGNIGLVIVLGTIGCVFGGAAYLLRRIGPTIIAHAMLNIFALILSVWVVKS